MNISHYAAINRSLNSQDSGAKAANVSGMSFHQSFSGQPTTGGGMLKPSMRFEYEFSPKRMTEQLVERKVGQSRAQQVSRDISELPLNSNLFSCMDGTEYEREFEVSPGLMARK